MFRADNGYGIALTGYSTAGDGRRWSDISDAEEVRGVDRQIVELEIEKSLRHLNLHPGAAGRFLGGLGCICGEGACKGGGAAVCLGVRLFGNCGRIRFIKRIIFIRQQT
eukprot:g5550.t1